MKLLGRKRLRTCLSMLLIAMCLLASFSFYIDSKAQDQVVDTFYVLDEDGNPVTVEITQGDLMSDFQNTRIKLFSRLRTGEEAQTDVVGVVRFKSSSGLVYYTEVDTGREGYVHCKSAGDAAYIRTESDGSVICKLSGVVMRVPAANITGPIAYESCGEREISYYSISDNGYLMHNYTYFSGSSLALASTRVGYKPSYLSLGVKYYSYDGHYFYDDFAKMIADYQNNVFSQSVNAGQPYYNYYQYLSMHTKAPFTPEQYNAYIAANKTESVMLTAGSAFASAQNKYSINALLMFGIAINESAWGTSSIAKSKNNLFGLNAVDSSPGESANTFKSVEHCINEFAYEWVHKDYLNGGDFRYRGPHLGDKHSGMNVKYASDPYWGEKAAARGYYFDTEKVDYGRYTIGITVSGNVQFYKEADARSAKIYTSEAGSGSGKAAFTYDFPVVILDSVETNEGWFYKVVSDMSLKADRSARDVNAIYDETRDFVYVKASDIRVVFKGSGNIEIPDIEIPDIEKPDDDKPEIEEPPVIIIPEKTQAEVLTTLKVSHSNSYLTGFSVGGDIGREIAKVKALDERIQVVAKKADGTQITSGTLATGMQLSVTTNGSTVNYTIVIRGDVNGDGKLSAVDYVKVRNYLDGASSLTGAYLKGADTSGDGKASALDYVKLRNHLDNKSSIVQ
ncbi:MAG: glucosaminidase domain-containing protein [Tyzzerella sp.]|nr:glucosaminidase domain-containing protein [Tyzzerella sp.]